MFPLKNTSCCYQEEMLKGLLGITNKEVLDDVLVLVTVLSINISSSRSVYFLGVRKQKEYFSVD